MKCMSGHYGELVFGQKRKIDILLVADDPHAAFVSSTAMSSIRSPARG